MFRRAKVLPQFVEVRSSGLVGVAQMASIAQDGVKWVSDLVDGLKIPSLSAHGMNESHIPEAVQKTLNANSYKGNPIALSEGELREVLEKAL